MLAIEMSDDVLAPHLAVYAQVLDSFTKTALGLTPKLTIGPAPKA
jgi:hypothetical protein